MSEDGVRYRVWGKGYDPHPFGREWDLVEETGHGVGEGYEPYITVAAFYDKGLADRVAGILNKELE